MIHWSLRKMVFKKNLALADLRDTTHLGTHFLTKKIQQLSKNQTDLAMFWLLIARTY